MTVTSTPRTKKCQYSAFLSATFPSQETNYLWWGVMKEREHVKYARRVGSSKWESRCLEQGQRLQWGVDRREDEAQSGGRQQRVKLIWVPLEEVQPTSLDPEGISQLTTLKRCCFWQLLSNRENKVKLSSVASIWHILLKSLWSTLVPK